MTADVWRDGFHYHIDFKKGEPVGGLKKEPATRRKTGTTIRWKPDAEVFTDVNVPAEYFTDTMKRQAVVNAGLELVLVDETGPEKATTTFCYQKGCLLYTSRCV